MSSPSPHQPSAPIDAAAAIAPLALPCTLNGSEKTLIQRKVALGNEIRTQFGSEVATVMSPYLATMIFILRREDFTAQERTAIETLAAISPVLQRIPDISCSEASRRSLLRDIFDALMAPGAPGSTLTLLATTCPDYSIDATGRYSSNGGLGSGTGLCARTIAAKIQPLIAAFESIGIAVTLDLCFADIEARDSVMCAKAGVDSDEFLARVAYSRVAAQAEVGALYQRRGLRVAVQTSSMQHRTDSGVFEKDVLIPQESISPKMIQGILSSRFGFYQRFFAEQCRGRDAQTFYYARAMKDIEDHLVVGHAARRMRALGIPTSIVTLSAPALVRFFNTGDDRHVPVLRIEQRY